MANWNTPDTSDLHTDIINFLKERDTDLATMFRTATTNTPTNAIRWEPTNKRFEIYSGASWGELLPIATDSYAISVTELNGEVASYYTNASNLSSGTLPALRFNDTAHGSRSGGTLHANANGTTAGFMTASDFNKLAAIEANATADQTAGEILTLIKSVDGSTSGLDADLLDNIDSNSFLRSDVDDTVGGVLTFNAIPAFEGGVSTISAPFTVDSDFLVTNLNADLLDGQHGSYYSPTTHTHSNATTSVHGFMSATDKTKLDGIESGATGDQDANEILTLLKTVDTDTSGLNADTLDGLQGAAYAKSDTADTISASWTISGQPSFTNVGAPFAVTSTTKVTNLNADLLDGISSATFAQALSTDTISGAWTFTTAPAFNPASGAPFTTNTTTLVTNLNADLLNGRDWSESAGNSTIVSRNGSGYIYGNYINMTGSCSNTGGGTMGGVFCGTNGTDTFLRSFTPQAAATRLSGSTMNIVGSSTSCTGNAATATKWATGRTITLSGDATGTSSSWDGSGNATLVVTVVNDSHNHSSASGNFVVGADLTPDTDNTGNVGTAALTWNNGQFTNMTIDSTISVRGAVDLADNDVVRFGTSDDFQIVFNGTDTIFRNYAHVGGDIMFQGEDTSGNNEAILYLDCSGDSTYCRQYYGGVEKTRTVGNGLRVFDGGIQLEEVASAPADTAGYGWIWVKNSVPNQLWYTTDTGVDYQLSGADTASQVKGWCYADNAGNIQDSYNVSSIVNGGTGVVTINWDVDFANTSYTAQATAVSSGAVLADVSGTAVGSIVVKCWNVNAIASNTYSHCLALGDQ